MPLGAHLPTSKGFVAALRQAQELGCDCQQLFTKSPRQWNAPAFKPDIARDFKQAWQESKFFPLVSHDSYLINLAAPAPEVLDKSLRAMIDEVERADALGCDFLVTHCGAHLQKEAPALDGSFSPGVQTGLIRLADSLRTVLDATPDARVKIALENTAGQGTCLGGPFEHIAFVLEHVGSERLCVCFDTCHAFAAGHNVAEDLDGVLRHFDSTIGLNRLQVVHLNDSKGELGGHLDRHEHIGEGQIGRQGMRGILTDARLKAKPFILETPEVETHIQQNLDTVRELRSQKEHEAKRDEN